MFRTADLAASIPALAGIGLRFQHHRDVIERQPEVGWMEVHPENYMGGGSSLIHLTTIRRDYPISLHGVGLSLGTAEGIDERHLERLARLAARLEPGLVSEHAAWSVTDGIYLADLLPLPMTEEALAVVCRNVMTTQDRLRRRILIENPSTCLRYRHSTIPEWEFMAAISKRTGCGLLCDINNIVVSAANHGFSARRYLDALPSEAIGEIHLAGHSVRGVGTSGTIRIDDHASPVGQEVWDLFREVVHRWGPVPVLIEWDNDIPALSTLLREAAKAETILCSARESRVAESV